MFTNTQKQNDYNQLQTKPQFRQKPKNKSKKDFKINSTILFRCYAAAKLCWVGFITAPKSSEVFLAHCYVVAKMLWVDSWCVICSFLLSKRAIPKFSMIFWSLDMDNTYWIFSSFYCPHQQTTWFQICYGFQRH